MDPLPWNELFFENSLPEKRLRERAIVIGEAMTERPGMAATQAFDTPQNVRNAYNFFMNRRMTLPILLDPALRATCLGLRELPEGTTVLSIQDTTELNLSHLSTMTGLGPITNPKNSGLLLHAALGVGTDGVPIGLLGVQTWVRPVEKEAKPKYNYQRRFEEKESLRWWTTIEQTEQMVQRPGLLLHVGDSEFDIYEVFHRAHASSVRILTRATKDRRVAGEHKLLWTQAEHFVKGSEQRTIDLSKRLKATKERPARSARTATVMVSYGEVTIRQPMGYKGRVPLQVIHVFEIDTPAGEEPVEWMLMTNDPIASEEDAWNRVDWYVWRWTIEEYFKVLKTGCQAEKRQFESRETFEVWLGFALLASVKLLALTKLARADPDQPASKSLTEEEEHVLTLRAKQRSRADAPLTIGDAVVLIAMLGGYLNRASDGPPGWITIWRGYERLCGMVEGYRIARAELAAPLARQRMRRKSAGSDAKE